MNILIADDNAKMRTLIKNLLFENVSTIQNIYECSNGQDAIKYYLKYKPDWSLLDIQMDYLDGLAVAEQIKSIEPKAKIIIVTNFDDRNYRKKTDEINVNAYILKENLKDILSILINDHKTPLNKRIVL